METLHRQKSGALVSHERISTDTPAPAVAPMADLLQAALAQPHQFHVHQLLSLLEDAAPEGKSPARSIHIVPSDWMSFPASDVRSVRQLADRRYQVEVTFGGFYGVDAPLPQYFLEEITQRREAGQRLQAFLDIFNQQSYWLRHQAWKKFRLEKPDQVPNLFHRIAAASCGQYWHWDATTMAQAGALRPQGRSAQAIASLLRGRFGLPDLRVHKSAASWCAIDTPFTLNGQQALGSDTLLGERAPSLGRSVTIQTGRISRAKATALSPEGEDGETLAHLVEEFLPNGVSYSVEVTFPVDESIQFQLGDPNAMLGEPLTLGTPANADGFLTQTFTGSRYQNTARGANSTHRQATH